MAAKRRSSIGGGTSIKNSKSLFCCKTKNGTTNKKKRKLTYRQKLSLLMLAMADFMSVCAMSIISPFYPAESAKKGVPASISGLIFAVYALIVFLSSPFFGKVLPKFGAKPMFTIGAFIAGICNMAFGLVDRFDSYECFVLGSFIIRIVGALGASAYSVAAYVLIVDIFPDNVGAIRGLLETFVGLGLSAGPGIGGILYTIGGFGLPFFVSGSIGIMIAFVNMYILPQPDKNTLEKSGSLISLLRLPSVLIACIITTVTAMSGSFLDPTLEPHLRASFSLTPSQVGFLFLLASATYGVFSPFWGWIADKLSNYTWVMTTGLFGTCVVLIFLGPSPVLTFLKDSIWLNAISLAALGITTAMSLIPTYQFMLDSATDNGFRECLGTHSTISGLWSSAYSLGEVIGTILGGVVMDNFDFPTTSSTLAAINLILAIITIIYFKVRTVNSKVNSEKQGVNNTVCCIENESYVSVEEASVKHVRSNDDIICERL